MSGPLIPTVKFSGTIVPLQNTGGCRESSLDGDPTKNHHSNRLAVGRTLLDFRRKVHRVGSYSKRSSFEPGQRLRGSSDQRMEPGFL